MLLVDRTAQLIQLCTIILIIRLFLVLSSPTAPWSAAHVSFYISSPDRSNKSCTVYHLLYQSNSELVSVLTSHNVTVSQTSLGRRCFHRCSGNQTNQSLMRYICNREDKSWTPTMFSISLPSISITVD